MNNLLAILGVTKQSLNRVLRTLVSDGLVEARVGTRARRERHLYLTEKGAMLEAQLSDAQRMRMRQAYEQAGPQAVQGFSGGKGMKKRGWRSRHKKKNYSQTNCPICMKFGMQIHSGIR